jgi:hypothetical protein
VRNSGVRGVDCGLMCGFGVGYGLGVGFVLKPSASHALQKAFTDARGALHSCRGTGSPRRAHRTYLQVCFLD